jgi:hypothetical protein
MSEIKYCAANCFTGFVKSGAFLKMITALLVVGLIASASPEVNAQKTANYIIPEGYLDEATNIPDFWLSTLPEIENFLKKEVRKGKVEIIGRSAGGRPLYTVSYGKKREGKGTTTFSGSLAVKSIAKYRGAESDHLVYRV